MEENATKPFVEVFSGSLWEADLVKGLLEASDILSMLKDETLGVVTSPYSGIGGQVKVLVDEADFDEAKRIIEERPMNEPEGEE